MNVFVPKQLDANDRILRFLDMDGLKATLGIPKDGNKRGVTLPPTFLLRSLSYYQQLEKEDSRCDEYEAVASSLNQHTGQESTKTCCNPILVSCWSQYEQKDLFSPEVCAAFPNAVAAIEATVGDVQKIMSEICGVSEVVDASVPNNGSIRSMQPLEHGAIVYYRPDCCCDAANHAPAIHFLKRKEKFGCEKEYRFAALCEAPGLIEPEMAIFRMTADAHSDKSYIKNIYLNLQDKRVRKEDVDMIKDEYVHLVTEIVVPKMRPATRLISLLRKIIVCPFKSILKSTS